MSVTVFNKKDFLDYIEKNISDDEVIITSQLIKSINYFRAKGVKEMTVEYPSFMFNKNEADDILNSKKVGILIVDRSVLKKGALDVVDGITKEFKI